MEEPVVASIIRGTTSPASPFAVKLSCSDTDTTVVEKSSSNFEMVPISSQYRAPVLIDDWTGNQLTVLKTATENRFRVKLEPRRRLRALSFLLKLKQELALADLWPIYLTTVLLRVKKLFSDLTDDWVTAWTWEIQMLWNFHLSNCAFQFELSSIVKNV